MIRLDCSKIRFRSQLDEKHFFDWGKEIAGFVRWEQHTLVLRSTRVSEQTLRNLLALFWRYEVPMQQLGQLQSERNATWFAASGTYWHRMVFGLRGKAA